MINFNDPFTGLMTALLVLVVIGGYFTFFGKVDKKR